MYPTVLTRLYYSERKIANSDNRDSKAYAVIINR